MEKKKPNSRKIIKAVEKLIRVNEESSKRESKVYRDTQEVLLSEIDYEGLIPTCAEIVTEPQGEYDEELGFWVEITNLGYDRYPPHDFIDDGFIYVRSGNKYAKIRFEFRG